jgi:two-component system chemotaxis sensor kinase CheA
MSKTDMRNEFLEALPAFISEAAEQIQSIEALLLEIEDNPDDRDLLNSLFRCAHTVKGSAGMFGLDRVVEFTHHVESMLDLMREGKLPFTPEIGTLLLMCNDQMRLLVEMGFDDASDTPEQKQHRAGLVEQLKVLSGHSPKPEATPLQDTHTENADAENYWAIEAKFGPETFRNGMDPLGVSRYLQSLGTLVSIESDLSGVPDLDTLVFDTCHTSFSLVLRSTSPREELIDAFSFVEDDCTFSVTQIESPVERLSRSIEELPDTPRIGDMLVAVGAVTPGQLQTALIEQHQTTGPGDATPKLGSLLMNKAGVSPEVINAAVGKQQKIREKQGDENRYIRVQADRLDIVINLLGELVIAGAGSGAALSSFNSHEPQAVDALIETLIENNQNMNRLIEEIRNSTLGLRMVPVGETFNRFKRVVRDTANELGKDVRFDIEGAEAELDKSMVEKIGDPLMHLVRNSLDHGLETPEERNQHGKPSAGHLRLSARHETGAIVISIEDDGRGIDREKVLKKAWSKGLVEQGVVPADEAIDMLIFGAGFSTAESVTNLSGRGVGMDVVRTNIEALRGSIRLHNRPGQGLRTDIRLPLTLAIIDGFLVGVGRSRFVLPLEAVQEVIESSADAVNVDAAGRHCVVLRGAVLPVVKLQSLYDIESEQPERVSIVVVQSSSGTYGIEVESLMGQNQTVIKPLGNLFKSLRGISGSAILGSGEVALIIDVSTLSQLAASQPLAHESATKFRINDNNTQSISEGVNV